MSKCVTLLRALLGEEQDRAFLIVAPYGTGKSLTATYLLQLVENRPQSAAVLAEIGASSPPSALSWAALPPTAGRSRTAAGS